MFDLENMEQKPSLEMVFMAVSSLYNSPNTADKERASQWLGELQKSVNTNKIIISGFLSIQNF